MPINPALTLIPNATSQPAPAVLYGTVSANQPAPSSFADPLYVVEPHAPASFQTFAQWPQCNGSTLPVAGDGVVFVRDNYGQLHVTVWYIAP